MRKCSTVCVCNDFWWRTCSVVWTKSNRKRRSWVCVCVCGHNFRFLTTSLVFFIRFIHRNSYIDTVIAKTLGDRKRFLDLLLLLSNMSFSISVKKSERWLPEWIFLIFSSRLLLAVLYWMLAHIHTTQRKLQTTSWIETASSRRSSSRHRRREPWSC